MHRDSAITCPYSALAPRLVSTTKICHELALISAVTAVTALGQSHAGQGAAWGSPWSFAEFDTILCVQTEEDALPQPKIRGPQYLTDTL